MEEKKKIGCITDDKTGEHLELVDALVGVFKGDRRVNVSSTEINSYVLSVRTPDDNGDLRVQQMHLSELDLSALMNAIGLYFHEKGMDFEEFSSRSIDKYTGYLYKHQDDLEEE